MGPDRNRRTLDRVYQVVDTNAQSTGNKPEQKNLSPVRLPSYIFLDPGTHPHTQSNGSIGNWTGQLKQLKQLETYLHKTAGLVYMSSGVFAHTHHGGAEGVSPLGRSLCSSDGSGGEGWRRGWGGWAGSRYDYAILPTMGR